MKPIKNPKISIISASYNHEKYIASFIKSILSQTLADFELIIIDDASTDNNLKVVKSIKDPRIVIIKHSHNMGPSVSINDGIAKSRGEYISFIATDDEALPEYLQEGVNFLDKNKDYNTLCFQMTAIDEKGEVVDNENLQQTLKFKNIEYYELLRQMFITGNMIPSPGEIIRKSTLKKIGTFNPSLLQTQDYDFHIKNLLENKVYVYQKPLIKYRQLTNKNNIDNHQPESVLRQNLELSFVLNNFLNIKLPLFSEVFKKEIKSIGIPTQKTIPYFLSRIAINTSDPVRQKWGYQTLLNFIQNAENLNLLYSLYSIQFKDIVSLITNVVSSSKNGARFSEISKMIKKFMNSN